jgi:3-hydroxyacyl-CoA dehydrogenase
MGRAGQKAVKGFYSYAADPRKGELDAEVSALIRKLADERGIVQRPFTDEEIVERFVLQLINVGALILEEGIAYRAADIDVVWVHGFGFPRQLGGPMFHAYTLGPPQVLARIEHWHAQLGNYWQPTPLLRKLAGEGGSFAAYDAAQGS